MKCSPQVEKEKDPEYTLQSNEEEPEYSPQSDDEEPEYSPQSDEEFDEEMYDDNNDDTYGEDFVVNCGIISVFPIEYDMVSEVSEAEEDFMPEENARGKPLCYYVMNNGMVEEQHALFERPDVSPEATVYYSEGGFQGRQQSVFRWGRDSQPDGIFNI